MTDYGIQIPTARLDIHWAGEQEDEFNEKANAAIVAKANELRAAGAYPGMEVWYFDVPGRRDTTAEFFDAVVVSDEGQITTLPPYAEIEGK